MCAGITTAFERMLAKQRRGRRHHRRLRVRLAAIRSQYDGGPSDSRYGCRKGFCIQNGGRYRIPNIGFLHDRHVMENTGSNAKRIQKHLAARRATHVLQLVQRTLFFLATTNSFKKLDADELNTWSCPTATRLSLLRKRGIGGSTGVCFAHSPRRLGAARPLRV